MHPVAQRNGGSVRRVCDRGRVHGQAHHLRAPCLADPCVQVAGVVQLGDHLEGACYVDEFLRARATAELTSPKARARGPESHAATVGVAAASESRRSVQGRGKRSDVSLKEVDLCAYSALEASDAIPHVTVPVAHSDQVECTHAAAGYVAHVHSEVKLLVAQVKASQAMIGSAL